jgi:hypothetical protein
MKNKDQGKFLEEEKEAFDFPDDDEDRTLKRKKSGSSSDAMYDPLLLEEIEEVFHDAHESFSDGRRHSKNTLIQPQMIEEDKVQDDPPTRTELPFFKDPKIKISIWTILKDSIHKDISRMSVPVYFNQPLGIL